MGKRGLGNGEPATFGIHCDSCHRRINVFAAIGAVAARAAAHAAAQASPPFLGGGGGGGDSGGRRVWAGETIGHGELCGLGPNEAVTTSADEYLHK